MEDDLSWNDGEAGLIGLPMEVPEFFGRDFATKLGDRVQREVDRFGRMLEKKHRGTEAG